jgi:hypothetical protein
MSATFRDDNFLDLIYEIAKESEDIDERTRELLLKLLSGINPEKVSRICRMKSADGKFYTFYDIRDSGQLPHA